MAEVRNEVGNEVRKEYIDREAVLALFNERYDTAFVQERTRENKEHWNGVCTGLNWGRNTITDSPAADVVEAVRCKECIYYEKEKEDAPPYCNNIDGLNEPDAGDYCSYGVRKGDCNNCNNHSDEREGGVQE